MLTRMCLTNFMSFADRTVFDFTASKYSILSQTNVYNNETLKGALFIGPNAAGKTNALRAISFLIRLIKGDGVNIARYQCVFAKTHIFTVEYEFLFNAKVVNYKIEYNSKTNTLFEELLIDGECALRRDGTKGELRIGQNTMTDDQLDKETLFLRTASFNTGRFPQEPTLRALIEFLQNSYLVDGYNRTASFGRTVTKYAEENGIEKINKYLEDFQYDFFTEYGSKSEGAGMTLSVGTDEKVVFIKRKDYPVPYALFMESQGNQVFIDMLPNLIRVIENPGMLVYDEFGNSLHNKLGERIIKFYMKKASNSQFFITSQHTNLVSNSVLRPDQINRITFEADKGSKVKRISEYKPREAQNLEKMYLGGMFEGLPIYEKL